MNKISTTVIISSVCVVMLGVIIWLNRDKFGKKSLASSNPGAEEEVKVPAGEEPGGED